MEIRLRGSAALDLADYFQISKSATSGIIWEALDVIYIKLSHLICWPEPSKLVMLISIWCNVWSKIAAIADYFGTFIERLSSLSVRELTWSSCKHKNTIKYWIGIIPHKGQLISSQNVGEEGYRINLIIENSSFYSLRMLLPWQIEDLI